MKGGDGDEVGKSGREIGVSGMCGSTGTMTGWDEWEYRDSDLLAVGTKVRFKTLTER